MGIDRNRSNDSGASRVRIVTPSGRPIQLRYRCVRTGRQIRVSTGTRDQTEAEKLRAELEARLLLGLETAPSSPIVGKPEMEWEDFREQYRRLHLVTLRTNSAKHAEGRLDIATAILSPRRLIDISHPTALASLQARLLAGEHSLRKMPRSAHTVRGYMGAVLAAVNWAYLQGWLHEPPRLRKLRTTRGRSMKGRPISEDEFRQMLEATESVVGKEAALSWLYVLEGLWASALRLGELLAVSWDSDNAIRPVWNEGKEPELWIPGSLQKNSRNETIPLLPAFEEILRRTPEADRHGWVFEPMSLQQRIGRKSLCNRPSSAWVGKIISRIGKAADIVVDPADPQTGRSCKYASAHDLRRSCAERLREAGVPPLLISRVMRHSSWETTQRHYAPGNIQSEAAELRRLLG